MRKFKREVRDFDKILNIIDRCQVVHLGLNAEGAPYVVPLSFGYAARGQKLTVYFHCATEGRKTDLIKADNRAALEWDILNGYVETGHSVTADYECVMAEGKIEPCEGRERVEGLRALLGHTGFENYSAGQCAALPIVAVYKVECLSLTAKKRFI